MIEISRGISREILPLGTVRQLSDQRLRVLSGISEVNPNHSILILGGRRIFPENFPLANMEVDSAAPETSKGSDEKITWSIPGVRSGSLGGDLFARKG